MVATPAQLEIGNRILASLPHHEYSRIQPHIENVYLEKGKLVYMTGDQIKYLYFPKNGLLSVLSATETGSTAEIAMVGSEGAVGLPVILKKREISYEVTVQIPVNADRIKAEILKQEFDRGERLQEYMLKYTHVLIAQIAQLSICNRFHRIEKALGRWLLLARDHVNANTLDLTHENISNALGVPRTAVTMAARTLQNDGLIRYSRGHIEILDHAGLEARSCECYRILHDELQQFLNDHKR